MVRCPQDDFSTDHGTHQLPRKEQLPTKYLPTFSLQSSITRISKYDFIRSQNRWKGETLLAVELGENRVSSLFGGCRAECIDSDSMGRGLGSGA